MQGLADAFILMRYPFDSPEAKQLNIEIFETIYYGALTASSELAEKDGPYETYEGSPASQGILQYDMWGVTPTDLWDWDSIKERIAKSVVDFSKEKKNYFDFFFPFLNSGTEFVTAFCLLQCPQLPLLRSSATTSPLNLTPATSTHVVCSLGSSKW